MRVLLGFSALSSLALYANAQQTVSLQLPLGSTGITTATTPTNGVSPSAVITVYANTNAVANKINGIDAGGAIGGGGLVAGGNWAFTVANAVNTVVWVFTTSPTSAQLQYRYNSGPVTRTTYICDPCCSGNPANTVGDSFCSVQGTGTTYTAPYFAGYACAGITRQYTYTGLVAGTTTTNGVTAGNNFFGAQIFDRQDVVSTFSFTVTKAAATVAGDPQISGLQGQDFQVHGIPDEIFNLITYPNLQVNARFVYLSSAECHDNFTACFAHPGTYIGEEGIRIGNDKVHIKAGSFKKGLTVAVNGQRVQGKHTVKLGSIELVNHRRVVVNTPVMTLTISNSDKFLNQESSLHDHKLLTLGTERRVLADGEQFHPEVPLHGLQGQTWRNVEYPSGLEYEGSINDYHVVDGNLYGTEFVFNQFKL